MKEIASLKPLPATGTAIIFRDTYQGLTDLVKEINKGTCHVRRQLVRKSYNEILKNFSSQKEFSSSPLASLLEGIIRGQFFN